MGPLVAACPVPVKYDWPLAEWVKQEVTRPAVLAVALFEPSSFPSLLLHFVIETIQNCPDFTGRFCLSQKYLASYLQVFCIFSRWFSDYLHIVCTCHLAYSNHSIADFLISSWLGLVRPSQNRFCPEELYFNYLSLCASHLGTFRHLHSLSRWCIG